MIFHPKAPKNGQVPNTPLPPGRLLDISPTARARTNRYFGHNSGSTAQKLIFFGSSVAKSPCATFISPENLDETASTGPQSRFFGFSPQIAPKQLSPQTPPLQATRQLLASRRVIKDPNWGLEGPKCVQTIRKHHENHPKVSPNTFGNFFFG